MFKRFVEIFARFAVQSTEQAALLVDKKFVHRGGCITAVCTERVVVGNYDGCSIVLFARLVMCLMFTQVLLECT